MMRRSLGLMVLLGMLLPLVAACAVVGGGESEPTPVVVVRDGTAVLEGTPTAGDVNYVRGLCRAINSYVSSLNNETRADPSLFGDLPRLLRIAAPILNQFREDLEDADPPDDLKRFHDSLVNRVRRIARDADEGQLSAADELSRFAEDIPNQPEQVRARMEGASGVLPECTAFGVDNLFGNTGQQ
jgi:hypothetical protein